MSGWPQAASRASPDPSENPLISRIRPPLAPAEAGPQQPPHQGDRHQQQFGQLDPVVGEQLAPLIARILPEHPLLPFGQGRHGGRIGHAVDRQPERHPAIGHGMPQQPAALADRAGQPLLRGQRMPGARLALDRHPGLVEPRHHFRQQAREGGVIRLLPSQRGQPLGQ